MKKWELDENSIGFAVRDRDKYAFMSNFYYITIKFNNKLFKSVEHAYQWSKTDDIEWKLKIENAKTPSEAKAIASSMPIKENWDNIKLDIMRELLKIKFSDGALKFKLLKTADKIIVEDSPWDDFWGSGKSLTGNNNMGLLLMELRDYFSNKAKC